MCREGKMERLWEIRSQTVFKLKLPWLVGIKKITRHARPPACLPRHATPRPAPPRPEPEPVPGPAGGGGGARARVWHAFVRFSTSQIRRINSNHLS